MNSSAIPGVIVTFAVILGALVALSLVMSWRTRRRVRVERIHPDERKWHQKPFVSSHVRFTERHREAVGEPWTEVEAPNPFAAGSGMGDIEYWKRKNNL
jgi:hypothetical protein